MVVYLLFPPKKESNMHEFLIIVGNIKIVKLNIFIEIQTTLRVDICTSVFARSIFTIIGGSYPEIEKIPN